MPHHKPTKPDHQQTSRPANQIMDGYEEILRFVFKIFSCLPSKWEAKKLFEKRLPKTRKGGMMVTAGFFGFRNIARRQGASSWGKIRKKRKGEQNE